ncbi:MAG: AfsR/SARP family transcriptional regulator, partial [Anaerolineae bacterium]
MPQLRIYLLGNPQVKHEEQSVEIGRRKAVALLAYLSVTGECHRRESLATLFWPDYDESSALAYLRRTLWALNQTPVGTWIDADRASMALVKDDDLELDVDAFQRHLTTCERHDHPDEALCEVCISHLTKAVELYRGDFMAGFTLEDSAAFDEWQFFQAEVLRGKATEAWESLVRCYEARGDFDKAIDYARCWLALDPLDEDAHRHLMALYAHTGQRAVALRQYESCVRRLKDGMNLAPSEETVDLYRRIRSGQFRQVPAEPSQIAARPSISVTQQPTGPQHNLPASSTPFVGRQAEIDQIKALLTSSDSRIVTLVGPGGMGKTRLALQTAREALKDFRDGVFFVPLAPLSTSGLLIQAIADALDFPFFQRESESPRDQLLNYLREKKLLLVLDNFEHLIAVAPLLSDVVRAAPGVTLLVTSRERLNLHGEWVFKIPGMRVPESSSVEELTEYGAVQLFIQSARRAAGHFDLTDENREDVVRICQLVAGSPLGIELSASWARLLAPREIVAEIEHSLDFLTTSLRDLPERHRSLRAVFEHSWHLLENEEQALFRRLSIFRGGFTREAAREVAEASLLHLSSLVDKSVLRRDPVGRYELHELLRQYAEEKLEAE